MEGRYVYCVADRRQNVSLNSIGIQGADVYTIPCHDLLAVVHKCQIEQSLSKDEEMLIDWVIIHQQIVDEAWKMFGTVLPISFDTIIRGSDINTRDWLRKEYENLMKKIDRFTNKAEYGFQVFWDPNIIVKGLIERDKRLKSLEEEIVSKPEGIAYMYKQKFEKILRDETKVETDRWFKKVYNTIKGKADDVFVENINKTVSSNFRSKLMDKKQKERQMLMNLSCLVSKDKSEDVREEVEKINNIDGLSVRFTGPWPPYSFVGIR